MKTKLYNLITATALAGSGMLLSCQDDIPDSPHTESTVAVGINTRMEKNNDNGETGRKARLLFWTEAEFHNGWMQGQRNQPSAEAVILPEDINEYNYGERVFYTGITYLASNAPYHATGYAPDYALTPSEDTQNPDYSTLNVKEEYQNGKIDFLSCDGNSQHIGSTDSPFTLEEHELKFRHLTACISFKAKRSDKMTGKIAVNNVKVTVKGSNQLHIPTAFERYVEQGNKATATNTPDSYNKEDRSTYRIKSSTQTNDIEISSPDKNYIRYNEKKEIGACYIVSNTLPEDYNPFDVEKFENKQENGTINLKIAVSADYSLITDVNESEYQFLRTAEWDPQDVPITTITGEVFYPGYRYEVLITFDSDEILLEGKNIGWEDGGEHYLPIYPSDKNIRTK